MTVRGEQRGQPTRLQARDRIETLARPSAGPAPRRAGRVHPRRNRAASERTSSIMAVTAGCHTGSRSCSRSACLDGRTDRLAIGPRKVQPGEERVHEEPRPDPARKVEDGEARVGRASRRAAPLRFRRGVVVRPFPVGARREAREAGHPPPLRNPPPEDPRLKRLLARGCRPVGGGPPRRDGLHRDGSLGRGREAVEIRQDLLVIESPGALWRGLSGRPRAPLAGGEHRPAPTAPRR